MKSHSQAAIRIPIDRYLILEFDVDIMDQKVPILFGLEHNMKIRCSTNEVEKTFPHHPTNTFVPLVYKKPYPEHGQHLYLKL